MKKGNLLVCAMLVMCQLSLAQVSRDSAYEFLKTNILPNDWEDKEINIFVSKELVIENTIITTYIISYDTLAVSPNYKTWFFYIEKIQEQEDYVMIVNLFLSMTKIISL